MYNSDMPTKAELPTPGQLLRSTVIAVVAAAAILVTIVLPAEYGIDPTGVGRLLGLAEMGEIKVQLAEEAEADRIRDLKALEDAAPDEQSSLLDRFYAEFFIGAAFAHEDHDHDVEMPPMSADGSVADAETSPEDAETTDGWRDKVSLTLAPGEGAEIKLVMKKGEKAEFSWAAKGGVVNYDLHGDGGGENISYEKGRGVPGKEGELEAAFDGNHGWFWRNREKQDVTITLKVRGQYSEVKRVM